jgi:CrcB protein
VREALIVALGGAIGSVSRYGISEWVQARYGQAFPWATLAVNVVGSLLLGVLLGLSLIGHVPRAMRAALGAGFLGAFTTFSTFSCETVLLAQDGKLGRAAFNIGLNLVLGVVAAVAGFHLARALSA